MKCIKVIRRYRKVCYCNDTKLHISVENNLVIYTSVDFVEERNCDVISLQCCS